jgi:hypothetical protein
VADLTLAARVKGLSTRPSPKRPSQPISVNGMRHLLRSPYYMGVVAYQGTKETNCTRPAVRVERIEEAIEAFNLRFRLSPALSAHIQGAVRGEPAQQEREASDHLKRARLQQEQAQGERQKLLRAHYAGAAPEDLLATEHEALAAAEQCPAAYGSAPDKIRRQINQGFLESVHRGERVGGRTCPHRAIRCAARQSGWCGRCRHPQPGRRDGRRRHRLVVTGPMRPDDVRRRQGRSERRKPQTLIR